MKQANTPYDDVFRTLLNDCSGLILPLINEIFEEHYSGDEEIVFYPNEHFLNQQDGNEQKRITDTCFVVRSWKDRKYHFECQSGTDNSILVRIFEYAAQIALDDGSIDGNVLKVSFPHSAVLALRYTSSTPDTLVIQIETPGGSISYDVPVMKSHNYTLAEIFEKNLLFLLPFYIFTHENRFPEYDKDETKFVALLEEYEGMKNRLEQLCIEKKISEYTKCTIMDMSGKVLEHIASNHEKVRKGVKSVMGGNVLEYEAKTIKNEGIREGKREGKLETYIELIREGFISVKEAAKKLQMSEEELRNKI